MTADHLKAGLQRVLATSHDQRKTLSRHRTQLVVMAEWEKRAGKDDNVAVILDVIAHIDKLATPNGA